MIFTNRNLFAALDIIFVKLTGTFAWLYARTAYYGKKLARLYQRAGFVLKETSICQKWRP